jgi:peptidoglycan/xylan/chitin deacetylase (PgdA/CDA1 family)
LACLAMLSLALAASGCVAAAPLGSVSADTFTPASPASTATSSPIPTSTPTPTAAASATPTWVAQGPDSVTVPILLYHRIAVSPIGSRYYVTPESFREQMKLLHDWEYQTITTEMLVTAIIEGRPLPPRPVLITFDDGHLDNYTSAFPIMREFGFSGVLYLVVNYVGFEDYLNVPQIQEMAAAGWEIGSHSLNHRDLTVLEPPLQRQEIVDSRLRLEELLGLDVRTFAYPFGALDGGVVDFAHFAGYIAAMAATGYTADQGTSNLFALQRVEIKGQDDVRSFTRFLPWHGDLAYLPTETATPTPLPTRTPIPTYTQYPTRTLAP